MCKTSLGVVSPTVSAHAVPAPYRSAQLNAIASTMVKSCSRPAHCVDTSLLAHTRAFAVVAASSSLEGSMMAQT